jgi:hypothetical protein
MHGLFRLWSAARLRGALDLTARLRPRLGSCRAPRRRLIGVEIQVNLAPYEVMNRSAAPYRLIYLGGVLITLLGLPSLAMAEPSEVRPTCRSDADCQHPGGDPSAGWCGPWNTCVSSQTSRCQSGSECLMTGHCTSRDGRCVVGSDEDCKRSRQCTKDARCSAKEGHCAITSSADCAAHTGCAEAGLCSALPVSKRDSRLVCKAARVDDCQKGACAATGLCALKAGRCVPSQSEHCAASRVCRELGRCSLIKGKAGRANQCGFGAKHDSECKTPRGTERYVPCEEEGLCTLRRGVCQATERNHCQWSTLCKERGFCELDPKFGACFQVASDQDCQALEGCQSRGECAYRGGGVCGPKASKHCAQSKVCKDSGRCRYDPGLKACVAR